MSHTLHPKVCSFCFVSPGSGRNLASDEIRDGGCQAFLRFARDNLPGGNGLAATSVTVLVRCTIATRGLVVHQSSHHLRLMAVQDRNRSRHSYRLGASMIQEPRAVNRAQIPGTGHRAMSQCRGVWESRNAIFPITSFHVAYKNRLNLVTWDKRAIDQSRTSLHNVSFAFVSRPIRETRPTRDPHCRRSFLSPIGCSRSKDPPAAQIHGEPR